MNSECSNLIPYDIPKKQINIQKYTFMYLLSDGGSLGRN